MLLRLRTPWTVGGKTYPAGALLAANFEAFLKGERKFDVLFEPTERKSLAGHAPTRNHIILNELDNVRSRLYVLTHKDGAWQREELPGLPKFGNASASAVDADESDDYFLTVDDYLTPATLSLGTIGQGAGREAEAGAGVLRRQGARRSPSTRRRRRTARRSRTSRCRART